MLYRKQPFPIFISHFSLRSAHSAETEAAIRSGLFILFLSSIVERCAMRLLPLSLAVNLSLALGHRRRIDALRAPSMTDIKYKSQNEETGIYQLCLLPSYARNFVIFSSFCFPI